MNSSLCYLAELGELSKGICHQNPSQDCFKDDLASGKDAFSQPMTARCEASIRGSGYGRTNSFSEQMNEKD